jgi:photosystem II stability/assembly factor-like uncharacterized protein
MVLITLVGGIPSFAEWQEVESGSTATFTDIHFWSENRGIVAGYDGTILLTDDGGDSWVPPESTGLPAADFLGFDFFDETHGILVGSGGTVLATSDGGRSWEIGDSGVDGWLADVAMVTSSNAVAVGVDGMILYTMDGGLTWEPRFSGTSYNLQCVAFMDADIGIAGGDWVILRTMDGGTSWSEVSQPMPNAWIFDVMLTQTGYGLAVGDFAAIKETDDGGVTWSLVTSSIDDAEHFMAVSIALGGRAIAVGSFGMPRQNVLRTYDGGTTWSPDSTGYDRRLGGVSYDGQTAWVTGLQGVILRSVDPVSLVPTARQNLQLHPAFPNPFNPQTNIAFELPKREMVSLRVFDMGGRLVRNLIIAEPYSSGRHEIVWNGRDDTGRQAASGTYFYRIEAGSFSETKRMVLIK